MISDTKTDRSYRERFSFVDFTVT